MNSSNNFLGMNNDRLFHSGLKTHLFPNAKIMRGFYQLRKSCCFFWLSFFSKVIPLLCVFFPIARGWLFIVDILLLNSIWAFALGDRLWNLIWGTWALDRYWGWVPFGSRNRDKCAVLPYSAFSDMFEYLTSLEIWDKLFIGVIL
jgi:hypothetical protein